MLDRTTNTILLRTTARPNTIISVNSRGGVQVGTEKLLPGPLSEKDEYELWYIPPAR